MSSTNVEIKEYSRIYGELKSQEENFKQQRVATIDAQGSFAIAMQDNYLKVTSKHQIFLQHIGQICEALSHWMDVIKGSDEQSSSKVDQSFNPVQNHHHCHGNSDISGVNDTASKTGSAVNDAAIQSLPDVLSNSPQALGNMATSLSNLASNIAQTAVQSGTGTASNVSNTDGDDVNYGSKHDGLSVASAPEGNDSGLLVQKDPQENDDDSDINNFQTDSAPITDVPAGLTPFVVPPSPVSNSHVTNLNTDILLE